MYVANRTIKLANKQAGMGRIIYKGHYTKKYNRFLKLCGKAGFNNVLRDAQNLMMTIKA